jgi:two-component system CheB/CheR fusion protein
MRRAVLNRMAECRIESVEEYTRCLEADPGEPASLATHLFIGVTRFFRDPGAFAALEQHLARLLRTPLTRPVFNVWVPACASGEEAYSIAILFLELLQELLQELPGEARAPCRVSILGTDIDGSAIAVARAGLFHPAIAQHLMPGRLSRFFSRERDGYRVTGEVRSMVDFRVHDVTQRPPPLLFDLISCRNLMIYLMPTLQSTLLSLFHAALYPRGALLLSPSESIGDSIDCYVPLSHVWKLYQAIPSTPVNACNL